MATSFGSRVFAMGFCLAVAAGCAESSLVRGDGGDGGTDGGVDGGSVPNADAGSENPIVSVSLFRFDQRDTELPEGVAMDECNFETPHCVGEYLADEVAREERCDFRTRQPFEFDCDIAQCRASVRYSRPEAVDERGRVKFFGSTNCQQPAPPCEDLVTNDEGTPVHGSVWVWIDRDELEEALDCELIIPPRGW